MKLISIVTPCYNEEDNVAELYRQVQEVIASLPEYRFEHIFIDNSSKDRTVEILKGIAASDPSVKIIVNSRNFGHLRSPVHGIMQASGEAVILLVADLQDPPQMIRDLVRKWEEGYKVVLAVKTNSEETPAMFMIRKMYYNLIGTLSDIELTKNNTGFGLYDRCIVEALRKIDDPYPYFRGMVSEIGFDKATIEYLQPRRKRGITKNNFYTLYDTAMLGITNHSRVPLRMATLLGFVMSALSLLVSVGYLAAKLIFWERFTAGMAPVVIGLFFFSSVQLFFIGILGEYIGLIYTQVQKRPLVIEKERVNF